MSRKAHIVGVGESQYTKWGKIVGNPIPGEGDAS